MTTSQFNLPDLRYFLAVAKHRSFRRAALELGVSNSALSHAIANMEARLGVRLFHRTNRSVTLTAAGEELQDRIEAPLDAIHTALDDLNRERRSPTGRIRINAPRDASTLLLAPVLPTFLRRYPDLAVEVTPEDQFVDIVAGGYDAGIRYGGTVPKDMIAQRLSPDLKWIVVGAPAYLAEAGRPEHPHDLLRHRCVRIRTGNDRIYRWEFERDGEAFELDVPGSFTTSCSTLSFQATVSGAGLFYCLQARAAPYLASGELETVLADWTPSGPGFFIYYSGRKQVSHGLRLLMDTIRDLKPLDERQ